MLVKTFMVPQINLNIYTPPPLRKFLPYVFSRPSVAGAVLQTGLSIINLLTHQLADAIRPKSLNCAYLDGAEVSSIGHPSSKILVQNN